MREFRHLWTFLASAMGELIQLSDRRRRADRGPGDGAVIPSRHGAAIPSPPRHGDPVLALPSARPPAAFFFDVGCPFSYLAAERVERTLGSVAWIPTASLALHRGDPLADPAACAAARARAQARANELRLPLVWPERFPEGAPMALRAAAHAAETSASTAFALAAVRLAFCGGFDLEDPEILAEAAAAAGMRLEVCLAAAADLSRDGPLQATARGLVSRGVCELPAVRIGDRFISGERRLPEAAAMLRASVPRPQAAPLV